MRSYDPLPWLLFLCSEAARRPPYREGLILESPALPSHPAIGVSVGRSFAFIYERSQEETTLADILLATRSRLDRGRSCCAGDQNQPVKDGRASRDGSLPQKVDKELCVPDMVNVSLTRTFRITL